VNELEILGIRIAPESPLTPDVAEMMSRSDAHAAALYPPESNHMVDAGSLAEPHVIFCVARQNGKALGCGAAVLHGGEAGEPPYAEIKRMWVQEGARGIGLGEAILKYLETETASLGVRILRLETGVNSHPARRLYAKCGYFLVDPFGDYEDDPLSVFYEKTL
jgi:putative acetyltransferase